MKWISVKDAVPEINQKVIVLLQNKYDKPNNLDNEFHWHNVSMHRYRGDFYVYGVHDAYVTHWIPFPELS